MTNTPVEVITSIERRRRWSRAEKERIVAAAIEPGAVASEVARAAGIHTSQLFRWRQELCGRLRASQGDDQRAGKGRTTTMISIQSDVRVWLATGHTDMRKGFDGLAVLVQETLQRNPHSGTCSCSGA